MSIFADRTVFEVFASDGQSYLPFPVIPKADNLSLNLVVEGTGAEFSLLNVYELKPIWEKTQP